MFKNIFFLSILVCTFCLLASSISDTPTLKCQFSNSKQSVIKCGSSQDEYVKPCQEQLNYKREEFSIDICLKKQGSQYAAVIILQNVNTFDVYELKVNQNYIDQNAQMSFLYQNPYKIYSALKQEESTITIDSNAQILIKHKFFRTLRLIPKKNTFDKTNIIIKRLIVLQSKQKQLIENEAMLKKSITQMSSKFDLIKKDKDAQIAQLKKEILILNSNKEKEKQSNELQSNQIKQIQQVLKNELLLLQRLNNSNLQRFAIQNSNKNLQIKYISSGWYGFLKSPHIQTGKITRLQVRQTKITNKHILYEVSTDKTMGMMNPFYHLECKSYYAHNGNVWQNGSERAGGATINDGTVVTIIADLINWKISWEANGNKLAETEISAAMRANKLYFIITMLYQNDEVEILDY